MKMRNKVVSAIMGITIATSIILTGCGNGQKTDKSASTADNKPVFKIGAIPDQDTAELEKGNDAVARYLSKELGVKVKFVPTVDYASLVTGFERGDINMAWFGGLTYVQARNSVPDAKMVVQRPVDQKFQSVFIKNTKTADNVNSIKDIKGKTFTFGSESSTSGHLMPRYFMTNDGLDVDKDVKNGPNYSGSHDTTIQLVQSGSFDTGALNITVWNKAIKEGKVDQSKVKPFYTTPEYYDYGWTLNSPKYVDDVYGKGTSEKIEKAFMKMNSDYNKDKDAKTALDFYQTKEWVKAAGPEKYNNLESVAKKLNLLDVKKK